MDGRTKRRVSFMKLEIYNYHPDTTPHTKISGGYVDVGGLFK